ncbi:MAG: hypothetical protein ACRDKE_05370 [Solirubrobacterales bacterium]
MSDSNELVVVHVASSQGEAEILLSVLRGEGIECISRMTNRAAGVGDGLGTWGPQEVLVRQRDAEAARELLSQDDSAPPLS